MELKIELPESSKKSPLDRRRNPGYSAFSRKQKKECLMEIEVYDTYARSEEGLKIHFDVMLPIGGDEATAQDKAREFIEKISETVNPVQLESCRFCHTETAKPEVGERVEQEGYCIVPIENCPDPQN